MVDKINELTEEKKKCEEAFKNFVLKYYKYSNKVPSVIPSNLSSIDKYNFVKQEVEQIIDQMPLYE